MLKNYSELLSPDDIEQIHNTTLKLLAKIGVRFPDEQALSTFRAHGFKVNGSMVYFTEKQVMNAAGLAPQTFTLYARTPAKNITIGTGDSVFAPAYGAPFLMDPVAGKRTPTMTDYHNLARLAHALPNQDLSGHLMVEAGNGPSDQIYLKMIYANIIHSDKPFIGSMAGATGARHTLDMASILFGDIIKSYPVTIGLADSLSPLSYSSQITQALMEYARARQPVIIAALIMAGATGPITLAGILAQQNAEVLAGITLAQLISPGTPVIYGSASTNMDLKTGMLSIGSPEMGQMVVATAQMARYYGLPSRGGGSLTDSNCVDAQAGFESMFGLLTAVNSGIDFVLHGAGILSSYLAFSYEKFVLDDELCGLVRHFRQGIKVSPDTLAYEVMINVGTEGHFLLEPHTVQRCRNEFWQPNISYRNGLESWLLDDRPHVSQRAKQRWQQLLDEHQDPPLDSTVRRQLEKYVNTHTIDGVEKPIKSPSLGQ